MLDQYLIGAILVHLAGLLQLIGYLSRNQLVLRHFLLAGTIFYIAYYILSGPFPQWHAVFWSSLFMTANLYVIVLLWGDRRHGRLTEDERRLAAAFSSLTPGQFRSLMAAGVWRTTAGSTFLTREGEEPESLYFVLEGSVHIHKGKRSFEVKPGLFIGEVAFLLGGPASASVEIGEGTKFVEWDRAALDALFARRPSLKPAFENLLNRDMAAKVGQS